MTHGARRAWVIGVRGGRHQAAGSELLEAMVLPDDPRLRHLHVTPHELDRYDDLYADEEEQR